MLAAVKRLIKEAAIQGHLDQDVAKAFTQIGGAAVVGVAGRTYEHTIIVGDAGGSSRQSVKGIP
jgi:hypothetical protein